MIRDARDLQERLKKAGMHWEAWVLQKLIISRTMSASTNSSLSKEVWELTAENKALKAALQQIREETRQSGFGPDYIICHTCAEIASRIPPSLGEDGH